MANQEVVNAINETMVPNGVKAINADSVRNLLLLMAEKMGEGTGSGAVRVHFFDGDDLDFSQVNFEDIGAFTPEEVGPFTPEEVELIESMMAKAQQDNKAAYKLLNEHREQGIADLVMGDESLFVTVMLIGIVRLYESILGQLDPEYSGIDWSAFSFNAVASVPMFYINGKADTSGMDADSLALLDEILEELFTSSEANFFNGISLGCDISSPVYYVLKEDGSVFYREEPTIPTEVFSPVIYLSGENGMTEDLLEANKKAYLNGNKYEYTGVFWSVRENFSGDAATGGGYQEKGGCVHEIYEDLSTTPRRKYFHFWKGTDMMQLILDQDGNATLGIYASINPTATE